MLGLPTALRSCIASVAELSPHTAPWMVIPTSLGCTTSPAMLSTPMLSERADCTVSAPLSPSPQSENIDKNPN